jgi:hypothetical protein
VRAIYKRAKSLKTTPYIGRPGHLRGTRELPLTPLPYVIVYAVKAEAVEILHIYDGPQDRPKGKLRSSRKSAQAFCAEVGGRTTGFCVHCSKRRQARPR